MLRRLASRVLRKLRPRPKLAATRSDIARSDFRAAPITPDWIREGTPVARSITLAVSSDDKLSTTIWECTAGRFRWRFRSDEIVHILEGSVTVREENGTVHELLPGDVVFFPRGLESEWHVHTYVKKLAIHRSE